MLRKLYMKQRSSTLNRLTASGLVSGKKLLIALIMVLVIVMFIGVFQDYVDSKRRNIPFFFSESILFKSFWMIFPPILLFLQTLFEHKKNQSFPGLLWLLFASSAVHIVLTAVAVWFLSLVFREQSYGVIKVLTFTLANDLVKILLVYGVFLFGLKYFNNRNHKAEPSSEALDVDPQSNSEVIKLKATGGPDVNNSLNQLVVSTGKNNICVNSNDILYIRSATPYVSIQLEDVEYLQSTTLKSIAKRLDPRFVRIHRSCIVNITKVHAFHSRLNGDYDLTLVDGSEIRLSRNYVKDFRNKFERTTQLKT